MAYQINLTGKEIDERLQNVGTPADNPDANGTLFARLNKNVDDIANIDSRQTNIEEVVSGAQEKAYFSLFLNLVFDSPRFNIDNVKVRLYRWSGKRYAQFKMFTRNGIGVSQKPIGYEIILKQEQRDGANVRTPYIHYNDNATEVMLLKALTNAFGERISYNREKKRRWRLQAFLNNKPITAPFDFRVSIAYDGRVTLTKGGMMRSVPKAKEVVYDGFFNGKLWLAHKKGSQFNIVFFDREETIKRFPMPGDPVSGTGETYGVVVAVKEKPTATAITYNILWTNGVALYEIGVLEEAGVLSYTCTSPAKKLCDDIYDYASKMSSGTLRDLYISAGAKYNEATGFYELNGLTDITEEEMRVIYKYAGTPQVKATFAYSMARTNFPMPGMYNGVLYDQMFFNCSNLEIANLGYRQLPAMFDANNVEILGNAPFVGCRKLHTIYGNIVSYNPSFNWSGIFGNCTALKEVRIGKLQTSIPLSASPNLSKESVLYMITNANPPSGAAAGSITITLHPTAYARLKDDVDIVAALEAKSGVVTLVSA